MSNQNPLGLRSDGTTIYVSDYNDVRLYAYSLSTEAYQQSKDIEVSYNGGAIGIWSNDTTIWVANWSDKHLYAYALSGGTRDGPKDAVRLVNVE